MKNKRNIDVSAVMSNLGFKDTTEEKPIHFLECLPVSFGDIYEVNSRWEKKGEKRDVRTEVLVGLSTSERFIDVIVVSTCGICVSRATRHLNAHLDWENSLTRLVFHNEQHVKAAWEGYIKSFPE